MFQDDYTKVYDEFADAIFRFCYLRISNRERAKDLMQDTFIKVWEYIEKDNHVTNVRAFLYKTANNLIIDEYRKKKTVSLDQLQEQGFNPSSRDHHSINNVAELGQAMKFINQLESKYSEVLIMRYIDDMSPKEIAEVIGEKENNVSVRINRAVKKVKELLNQAEIQK